jgi:murein endopeptidase
MLRPPSRRITAGRPNPWFWATFPVWCWFSACEPVAPPTDQPPPEAALERRQAVPVVPDRAADNSGHPITYTISRGGTLRNVANLYKLYHHEIAQLNPALDPDRELEPSTEVVVFRDLGRPSESVGYPHEGEIDNALPMVDGPGRKITAERWKTWATRNTVDQLDRVLERWAEVEPSAPPVLIGNLSSREGGPLSPHKSHQSGRDVDLSYITKWNGKDRVNWQHVTADNLDPELTWRLIKLITQDAEVEVIYMDRRIQRMLLDHAKRHGTIRRARLGNWLEVAGGSDEPLIRHVAGHQDHFHVRFACPAGSRKCRS